MPIFNKQEKAADELPVSGCGSVNDEQYERIYSDFLNVECETTSEKFFYYGFLAGLAFMSCPEGEEMHGKSALEFAENAYLGVRQDEVARHLQVSLAEAAQGVLKEFGINGNVLVEDADDAQGCGDE